MCCASTSVFKSGYTFIDHNDRSSGFNGHHVSVKHNLSAKSRTNILSAKSRTNIRQRLRDDKFRKLHDDDVDMKITINQSRGTGHR